MAKARRIKGIDCKGTAVAGIQLVLTERLDEMCALRESAMNWNDPEGVHSMRVASRRLRSALRDFMPYINERGLGSTLKQTKSIADALGKVRDQDVAIVALESLASQRSPEVSIALRDLIESRNEARRTAREQLMKILVKDRLKQLSLDFDDAIKKATTPRKDNSVVSYLNMARAVIRDRLNDLEKLSDGLYKPLETEPLHEMRIASKRLRYAIELFHECWDSKIIGFAKRAARLQSTLGEIHDCDVWIESFGKQIVRCRKLKQRDQSEAFVWLLRHFMRVRNRHLQDAFKLWGAWETEDLSNKLRESLKS